MDCEKEWNKRGRKLREKYKIRKRGEERELEEETYGI
jgi:hypothetical protein